MANNVYNTIRSINALFMFNFMLCALCFWGAHPWIIDEEKHYIFTRILDDPYLSIVSGYLITYGIMSLIFSILFVVLKAYNKPERYSPNKYLIIFLILFFAGLFLDATAWYYWQLGGEYNLSGGELIFSIAKTYINDLIFIYFKGILLWFVSTIVITSLLVKQGSISDKNFYK